MEPLKLANSKKEWFWIIITLFIIFSINLYRNYDLFKELKSDEICEITGKIINIFPKEEKNILKIETSNFTFFTASQKDLDLKKFQSIHFILVTEKIKFIDYLQGFFAPIFSVETINTNRTIVENINYKISSQHTNKTLGELFNTLFFATPIDKELQNLSAIYGIAPVISISGFHLGIISFVSYWILNILYSPFHQKYFPYRNKKLDLLVIISILLFIYLLALNIIPSFLRSFMMFIVGIFLLRSNIKILSFGSLGIITLLIIAFFPKLLFSLSLWFSIAGVFYILLFIQYFSHLNKYIGFIFFNFWIFFAVNPITHFFFGTTAFIQLLSPIITIGFIVFYPLELISHLIGYGDILDNFLELWIATNPKNTLVFTPVWLFGTLIMISLLAIWNKLFFYLLNIVIILFNSYLFLLAGLIYYG